MISLKNRVIAVSSLLILLGLWVFAGLVGSWQREELRELMGRQQFSTVSIVADEVTNQLSARIEALKAVASLIDAKMMANPAALTKLLSERPSFGILFNVGHYAAGLDGICVANYPPHFARVGVDYSQRTHIQAALAGLESVGEIVLGAVIQAPVFSIAVPIFDGKVVVGALVGVTDLSRPNFLESIQKNSLGDTGGYLLVSRRQRLVVTSTDENRVNETIPALGENPTIDRFLAGGEGSTVFTNPLGQGVLVSVKQIPLAGWLMAAETPTAEAFAPADSLQDKLLLLALGLTVVVALLNWLLLTYQLAPVEKTIHTLSRLSEAGQVPHPIPIVRKDEIGELVESLNRLLRVLGEREKEREQYQALASQTQRLESLGLLAGGIAHDFNNLLAGIYSNLELARLKTDPGAHSHLDKTLATVDRARNLTRQLLTFAKGGEPRLAVGPLFPVVEDTVRFAVSGLPVTLEFDVEPGLWTCRFDPNQLSQVIENLVINAHQAMPQWGKLTVSAQNVVVGEERFVRLSFADTGSGMTPEVIAQVFEPFFTTKPLGNGLGLPTCFSIVRKHGGTIDIESEPGHGSTFHVQLPAAEAVEVVAAPRVSDGPQGNGTILVLDDEVELGNVLAQMLEILGYQSELTTTGEQALEVYRHRQESGAPLVAALLDLTVRGGMGGVETLHSLRQMNADLPVFVVSGYSESAVLADPATMGFTDGLHKPFLLAELKDLLHRNGV